MCRENALGYLQDQPNCIPLPTFSETYNREMAIYVLAILLHNVDHRQGIVFNSNLSNVYMNLG